MKVDLTFAELNTLIGWGGDKNNGRELFKRLESITEAGQERLTGLRNTVASLNARIDSHMKTVFELENQLIDCGIELKELENS